MRRTQDLVIARLRQIALRWRSSPARAVQPLAVGPAVVVPTGPRLAEVAADAALLTAAGPDPGADADPHSATGPCPDLDSGLEPGADPIPAAAPGPRVWLRLLGVLAVVVLLAGVASLVRSWPTPDPIPAPDRPGGVASPALIGPVDGFGDMPASPSAAASLVVHVAGEVRRPGVVVLPAGSRVADAVEAAGGLRKGAELGATNLARVLADGERVEIGGEQAAGSGVGVPGGVSPAAGAPLGLVDLNAATAEQLDALPGIGPVTAAKILAWRAAHGRFSVVDELAEVPGIGPKTLEELRPHVRV